MAEKMGNELATDDYALLDAGKGRRLERFGSVLVNRPAPMATGPRGLPPQAWQADLYYDLDQNAWRGTPPENWRVRFGPVTFSLAPLAQGQVGMFPEQSQNWAWLRNTLTAVGRPLSVLNLFGYTGGSTLAAASVEGVECCHVDAAKPAVRQARENAALSGLDTRPVRWIVEDALTFVRREEKRGRRYDAVVFDPPAFGRSDGKSWKLTRDLDALLTAIDGVLADTPLLVLFTCHDPQMGPDAMRTALRHMPKLRGENIETGEMVIPAEAGGNALALGHFVRWTA